MKKTLSTLAVLAALAPAASAADQTERDCLWAIAEDSDVVNVAYPDELANYWGSPSFVIPPGGEVVLRGTFPHTRYMSINLYDAALRPTDAIADEDIVPDPGSANPFLAGARRDTTDGRSYTLRIVSGVPPASKAERESNTLYLSAGGRAINAGGIIYRVYIPDAGQDPTGGAGLPESSIRLADGTEMPYPDGCGAATTDGSSALAEAWAESEGIPALPVTHPARNPLDWEVFFNMPYTQAGVLFGGTPAEGARTLVPKDKNGGYLSNVHNAYAYAVASRQFGPALVLEGKAPTFPRTRDGQAVMGAGQVRYWSICQNERFSTRFVACLGDEDIVVDGDGRYTLVMSTPGSRPANARPSCGINWLPWGASTEGLPILRHMLPAPDFANAIQRVNEPGTEEQVVGEYLPTGIHMTRGEFEARGCQ